jgi:hypothetical protein
MTSDPVQFPRDIVPELHRRVEESKAQLVRPVPSVDVIRTMVDVAYAASMLEVEGRRVRLALGFLTPAGARALNYASSASVPRYRWSRPLLAGAMATESLRTALGVQQSSTGAPEIWGMLHHGDRSFGLSLEHKPPYFSVRVLRAGTFTVDFDERPFCVARDHARFSTDPSICWAASGSRRHQLCRGGGLNASLRKDARPRARRNHSGRPFRVDRGRTEPSSGVLGGRRRTHAVEGALAQHEDAISDQHRRVQ